MIFDKLKSVVKTPEIEFLCFEEDYGVIPEPYPARKFMPDWYKHLPARINKQNKLENSTVKRCPPVLDAMSVGWIIPLVADVEIISNGDASGIEYKWQFYRTMIENHGEDQISTKEYPNPNAPKPPIKFMNWWAIRVPPGYSVLFVPPMNRQDPRFTCMSGFVDCDAYFQFINFPGFFHTPNYTGILDAGTPLVQAIPIRRDAIIKKEKVGKFNEEDKKQLNKNFRLKQMHESYYRDLVWSKK